MKIGFLWSSLFAGGGMQHWLHEVVTRLPEAYEPRVLALISKNEKVVQPFTSCETLTVPWLTSLQLYSPSDLRTIKRFFDESDIVYFTYSNPIRKALSLFLQFYTQTPVVCGHHETSPDWSHRVPSLLGPSGIRLGRHFSGHHALNEETKRGLMSWGARNVFKIPNGVDCRRFVPLEKYEKFSVLYLAKLYPYKGADLIPTLAERLKRRITDFDFYVAGEGPLQDLVSSLADKGIVKYLGHVQEKEKTDLLQKCQVLVAPSRFEAFPLVGLEAMASGTPVVTFDIPGPREYIKNGYNGYLASDLETMIESIVQIHRLWKNDHESYSTLMRNSRGTAEMFSWDAVIPRLTAMFSSLT